MNWLVQFAIVVLALGAIIISVCALYVAQRGSDQREDSVETSMRAIELAERAHGLVTGLSFDEVDTAGRHHDSEGPIA